MDLQLKKFFGLALVFALVFGMVSAERAVAQTTPLDPVDCPEGDTITVDTDTFLTVDTAEKAAREAEPAETERKRTMQELFDCAIAKPGSTVQFADGTYDNVGRITIGNATNSDGDDPDTDEVTEKVTLRGNPANREAVKFTGEVNFSVQASNISMEYITFEDTENIEMLNWPHVVDALEVGQTNLAADKCRENVEIRNCVFRNTRKDGVSYFTGDSVKADCTPRGFTVADSLFENIGYNNEWEDGYGPGDMGTGIPKLLPATVEGATTFMNGTTPHQVRDSYNVGIRVHGSGLIKNVTITGNTIDGTTHSGIVVHGVTGVANEAVPEESDKIEISNNSVRNVPRSGIVVLELPRIGSAAATTYYDLVVGNNLVVNSGNSPWTVTDYYQYKRIFATDPPGSHSPVRSILGGGTAATDKVVDGVLKPEIWSITEKTVKDDIVNGFFGSEGAPVNIYDNFGGDGDSTDGRVSEYAGNGNRVSKTSSKIPASGLSSGNYADNRAGSCIEDDRSTSDVNERHFACFSVVRFLDPYATGAIQLNGVSTNGAVRITRNELRDNTLGLVLCGGVACYFDNPYSAVTAGYTSSAAFAKPEISMNNIYGESAMSAADRGQLPTEFAMGAVYASIGELADKVDLSGNYLGTDPVLITDSANKSLERDPSMHNLEAARLDIEIPELPQPSPPGTSHTVTGLANDGSSEISVTQAVLDAVPHPPTLGNSTVSATLAQLFFNESPDNGGSQITHYEVQWKSGMQHFDSTRQETTMTTTVTIMGLMPSTTYTYRIRAVNDDGNSSWSGEGMFTTTAPATTEPGQVASVEAFAGNARVTLSWTAPSNGGSMITGYEIQWKSGSQTFDNADTDGRQQTRTTTYTVITGLSNGTAYDFRVRAVNAKGAGAWSAETTGVPTTSATVPGMPTSLAATVGNAQVALSWTAPADDGGSAITHYEVQWKSGTQGFDSTRQETSTTTSVVISSLTNGTAYDFRVRAVNAIGEGVFSSTFMRTTPAAPTVPGQVTGFSAQVGDSRITLSWSAPSSGGLAITSYTVQWRSSSGSFGSSRQRTLISTSETITELSNGTAYDFRVRATNSMGDGVWSATITATPTSGRTTEPPLELSTAAVIGDTLTLTYNKTLDEESVPAASDFTVMVEGEERGVTEVSVSGETVTLTLASAVEAGDAVTVSYTPGENPIRDASGENAAALTDDDRTAVSNNTSRPTPPGGGGCALTSGGSGVGLGMLLALMVMPFGFAATVDRRAREAR